MLRSGGNDVNSCGIDACVPEKIGKLGNILFNAVEHTGKQMAQIMRKYFLRTDVCLGAQGFHFTPDVDTADGFAGACNK